MTQYSQNTEFTEERKYIESYKKDQVTFKGRLIRITTEFSIKIFKARWSSNGLFQILKGYNCQTNLIYPAKLSITIKGERKTT